MRQFLIVENQTYGMCTNRLHPQQQKWFHEAVEFRERPSLIAPICDRLRSFRDIIESFLTTRNIVSAESCRCLGCSRPNRSRSVQCSGANASVRDGPENWDFFKALRGRSCSCNNVVLNVLRSFLYSRSCLSADPASGERREGCSKYRAPGKKKEGKRRREQRRGPAAGTEGKGRCHRGMVQDATVLQSSTTTP